MIALKDPYTLSVDLWIEDCIRVTVSKAVPALVMPGCVT